MPVCKILFNLVNNILLSKSSEIRIFFTVLTTRFILKLNEIFQIVKKQKLIEIFAMCVRNYNNVKLALFYLNYYMKISKGEF